MVEPFAAYKLSGDGVMSATVFASGITETSAPVSMRKFTFVVLSAIVSRQIVVDSDASPRSEPVVA